MSDKGAESFLEGEVVRVTFHNPENGYFVAKLKDGRGGEIGVIGTTPSLQPGETLQARGVWEENREYGRQFRAREVSIRAPGSLEGIRLFLAKGGIDGIGEAYAGRIVERFGEKTLDVIDRESARLLEVEGIGRSRLESIRKAWREKRLFRDVLVFLHGFGVPSRLCWLLVEKYGDETLMRLQEDPYRVAREMSGIGFRTADMIALKTGFAGDSTRRIQAALCHVVAEAPQVRGHTSLPAPELIRMAAELLEMPEEEVAAQVPPLKESKALIPSPQRGWLQDPKVRSQEKDLAEQLGLFGRTASVLPPIQVEKALEWAAEKSSHSFSPEQAEGLRMALSSRISILTGGPGTGKTTILRSLVRILSAKKVRIALAAPTGRAASRMAESCQQAASTLHRLLGYDPASGQFVHHDQKPLEYDFFIVDEVSMLDLPLAQAFFRAVPKGASVLLVGDHHQLPSVGPGQILHDLILSQRFPVTRLEKVFRQADRSRIAEISQGILRGELPDLSTLNEDECQFESCGDSAELEGILLSLVKEFGPKAFRNDVQILCPIRRSFSGTEALNPLLQKRLNASTASLTWGSRQFSVGDRVIQVRNNYDCDLFNGETGWILRVDAENNSLEVQFDGRVLVLQGGQLSDLELAWALTVHKSQGSEYPVVVLPLFPSANIMLQRNLLYTAVTRAKKRLILLGDPEAFQRAARNSRTQRRFTSLREYF